MILYSEDNNESEYDRLHLDEELEKNSCIVILYNIFHTLSVALSTVLIFNSILLKYHKFDYIELNDNLLLGFFVVGIFYFIHSILSLSSCMKKRCLKSRCLYLYYVIFVCECLYFGSLYGSHKEYYKTIEIKVFTLSMVCFHFVYFVLLTCVKYCM